MRLIDSDAVVQYLLEFRCADCDRRKGMKNGKVRFCYEIGDAPCRACDIGDTIEYFLDEAIAPTIDAIPMWWITEKFLDVLNKDKELSKAAWLVRKAWQKEQEAR